MRMPDLSSAGNLIYDGRVENNSFKALVNSGLDPDAALRLRELDFVPICRSRIAASNLEHWVYPCSFSFQRTPRAEGEHFVTKFKIQNSEEAKLQVQFKIPK